MMEAVLELLLVWVNMLSDARYYGIWFGGGGGCVEMVAGDDLAT